MIASDAQVQPCSQEGEERWDAVPVAWRTHRIPLRCRNDSPNRPQLWSMDASATASPHTHDELARDLLAPEERARMSKLHRVSDRDLYLRTRVLVRLALSQHHTIPPEAWRFAQTEHGRPVVSRAYMREPTLAEDSRLYFSVSRSGDLAVCAIAAAPGVGVDIEDLAKPLDARGIARGVLTPKELQAFEAVDAERQAATLLRFWTLKEAYLKALSIGLLWEPTTVGFSPPDLDPISLDTTPATACDGVWHFNSLCLFGRYQLALAWQAADSGGDPSRTPASR